MVWKTRGRERERIVPEKRDRRGRPRGNSISKCLRETFRDRKRKEERGKIVALWEKLLREKM